MKKTLILSVALATLSGAAWAQTTQSPPRLPLSQGEQEQRCMEIANEAQRLRCLNEIRPGSGVTAPIDRPPNMPAEIIENVPRPREPQTPRNPTELPQPPLR